MSDSLQSHGLQHIRRPCPSLSLGVCSNSCSLSQWCHPTISSSFTLFSSCLSWHQGLFQWVGSSYQVAYLLELQLQHQSFQWIFRIFLESLLQHEEDAFIRHYWDMFEESAFFFFLTGDCCLGRLCIGDNSLVGYWRKSEASPWKKK